MNAERLLAPVVEVRLPCGVAAIRPEVNGRLWLVVDDSGRPPLRLRDDGEVQFTLCGVPPAYGIMAGLIGEGVATVILPPERRLEASQGGGAWLVAIPWDSMHAVIEDGALSIQGPAGEQRRRISTFRAFVVDQSSGEGNEE
jgi:hypothetical protein